MSGLQLEERTVAIKEYIKTHCLSLWPSIFPTDRITENVMDAFWDEGNPLSEGDIYSLIEECKQELREIQSGWPSVTDCDRLDKVGADLDLDNILFVQHIDTTPSSCWAEINDIIEAKHDGSRYIGAVFYHFQSTERALAHNKMHMCFGTTAAGTAKGVADGDIRKAAVEALMKNGIEVPIVQSDVSFKYVNGNFVPSEPRKNREGANDAAIEINPILWQKRLCDKS